MDDDELPHGFTLNQLAAMSRHIAFTSRMMLIDPDEAIDVAACALIERLYTSATPPLDVELFDAGRRAVEAASRQVAHDHGYDLDRPKSTDLNRDIRPGFTRYWRSSTPAAEPEFVTRITETTALAQVWHALADEHREVLAHLAYYDNDLSAAAATSGHSYGAFKRRVVLGRRAFRRWWFEGEPDPGMWGKATGLRSGYRPMAFMHCRKAYRERRPAND